MQLAAMLILPIQERLRQALGVRAREHGVHVVQFYVTGSVVQQELKRGIEYTPLYVLDGAVRSRVGPLPQTRREQLGALREREGDVGRGDRRHGEDARSADASVTPCAVADGYLLCSNRKRARMGLEPDRRVHEIVARLAESSSGTGRPRSS
jgi:hypothetical protein